WGGGAKAIALWGWTVSCAAARGSTPRAVIEGVPVKAVAVQGAAASVGGAAVPAFSIGVWRTGVSHQRVRPPLVASAPRGGVVMTRGLAPEKRSHEKGSVRIDRCVTKTKIRAQRSRPARAVNKNQGPR
ncbi:MAG: hypothetical protein ACE5GY_07710, partial [Thermodesulfobacteriota bacterium]